MSDSSSCLQSSTDRGELKRELEYLPDKPKSEQTDGADPNPSYPGILKSLTQRVLHKWYIGGEAVQRKQATAVCARSGPHFFRI